MNKSKLTDDINENLKQTLKKIDELDNEKESMNDFTDNQSSQANFFKNINRHSSIICVCLIP